MGQPNRKRWTPKQVALLRTLPPIEVAIATGRSVDAVLDARRRYGAVKRRLRDQRRLERDVRRLHARGWPAGRIARALRLSASWVGELCRRLGLPSNRLTPEGRAWIASRTRGGAVRRGFGSITQLRYANEHRAAARAGWPAGATAADVRLLEVLRDRGPVGVRDARAALGLPPNAGTRRGSCNIGVRLRRFARAGWAVVAHGPSRGRAGGRVGYYALAPAVLARHRGEWAGGEPGGGCDLRTVREPRVYRAAAAG